ncbi:MAG: hypothetical protein U9N73_00020 [Candidatus Auribacterota bacterium]|nr:hypothetical protein [Candidatus Auribacterota bacterium]
MKVILSGVVLLYFLFLSSCFPQDVGNISSGTETSVGAYDRTTVPVRLNNASPAQIEEALQLLNRNWGLFPSLQYLRFSIPGGGPEVLFLRGRNEEVESARSIAENMDALYPPEDEVSPISSLSLVNISAGSMKENILSLSPRAGLGIAPEQLIVFPDKAGGSLFFRGSQSSSRQIREIKDELDRPRYESFFDLIRGFLRAFRGDISTHFLTVSTYAASALLLLLIHFILIHLPWLGRLYQRWFTLIWTRMIDDIKGRGFAFEVIKSLAETAVDAVEQESTAALKSSKTSETVPTGQMKKVRGLAIARELLIYRGFNPDDPQVKRIVNDVIEGAVFRLKTRKASNR